MTHMSDKVLTIHTALLQAARILGEMEVEIKMASVSTIDPERVQARLDIADRWIQLGTVLSIAAEEDIS